MTRPHTLAAVLLLLTAAACSPDPDRPAAAPTTTAAAASPSPPAAPTVAPSPTWHPWDGDPNGKKACDDIWAIVQDGKDPAATNADTLISIGRQGQRSTWAPISQASAVLVDRAGMAKADPSAGRLVKLREAVQGMGSACVRAAYVS